MFRFFQELFPHLFRQIGWSPKSRHRRRRKEVSIMMKKLVALLTALMLLAASSAMAETKIAVTGSGETPVGADTAIISLGVSARNRDVLTAQQQVNAAIAAIRKALTEKGVRDECINTDCLNIYAMYDYSKEQEEISAYNATSTLAIRTTDMDSIGALIDTAFAAGANTLNGISFSADDTEAAKAESLKKAVAEAKAKAQILAEAAGMKITGMESMSEIGVYSYDNSVSNFAARGLDVEEAQDMGAETVVQAAKLIVNASVSITFIAE